jgi:hypothetical protein
MQRPTHHLPHVLLFLQAVERLRADAPGPRPEVTVPDELFLLRDEGDFFWELVALSLRGYPSLLLGGLRFRRQVTGDGPLCRQSLVSYLSSPVRELGFDHTPRPPHLVEVMVPDTRQPLGRFLDGSRAGDEQPVVLVGRKDIRFAFDFRLANPSRSHRREQSVPASERYVFRSEDGHVLSAAPHQLPSKLHREDPFLALTKPTQHTASLDRPLPTLVAHRDFLTTAAPVGDSLTAWLHRSAPFHVELANPAHLLDPELDSYRAYRHREIEDSARQAEAAMPRAASA